MNKTVLITGASSGIGLEISKIFARDNYDLVLISQNIDNLNMAKEIISNEYKAVKIYAYCKDLSDAGASEEIYEYTCSKKLKIDILVNNAGIQVYGKFHEVKEADIIKLMYINMYALTGLTRKYIEEMVKCGSGKILNIASTGAFQACPLNSVYCASKAYVLHLSEAIQEELKGSGVTITTLCPGATRTNFAKRAGIEEIKLFKGKVLAPDKVAEIGYRALMQGKAVVTTGISNKLMVEAVRFMPRKLVTKVGMRMMMK